MKMRGISSVSVKSFEETLNAGQTIFEIDDSTRQNMEERSLSIVSPLAKQWHEWREESARSKTILG